MENFHVIVGLGVTGLSCAHYLARRKLPFVVMDTRENPPHLDELRKLYPDVAVYRGGLDETILNKAKEIILSPGISIETPVIKNQLAQGKPVIGDIELFARVIKEKPLIAITGTNAKSTVTSLVGEMAKTAGIRTKVGGNLGIPALDLVDEQDELYVIELSSFQLETLHSLKPKVASVLNITPDHMDRYPTFAAYCQAKQHIYQNCEVAVCNRDDKLTDSDQFNHKKIYFTLQTPQADEFGLIKKDKQTYLAHGDDCLLPVAELAIAGKHYQANALAALAIGYSYGLPQASMLETLIHFKGLPHRCQLVRELRGVRWYNDSKGTNVGATLAAIEGLGEEIHGKLVIIAGGLGKNADFSPLLKPIKNYARAVVLIGEAAAQLAILLKDHTVVQMAQSMEEAVLIAQKLAQGNDSVLLSPACASMDMFKNFEHRGDVFTALVHALM